MISTIMRNHFVGRVFPQAIEWQLIQIYRENHMALGETVYGCVMSQAGMDC